MQKSKKTLSATTGPIKYEGIDSDDQSLDTQYLKIYVQKDYLRVEHFKLELKLCIITFVIVALF